MSSAPRLVAFAGAAAVAASSLVLAPAANAAEPAGVTSMNWLDDDEHMWRLTNPTLAAITGDFKVTGAQPQRITLQPGDNYIVTKGVRGQGQTAQFIEADGATSTKSANPWFITGHIQIKVNVTVAPGATIPTGFKVTAKSNIEEITWTWDGSKFVEAGDKTSTGTSDSYVYEDSLDVPAGTTWTITHDVADGVTVTGAPREGTTPTWTGGDPNAFGQSWYTNKAKYQAVTVTVDGHAVTPVTPTPPSESGTPEVQVLSNVTTAPSTSPATLPTSVPAGRTA
jgi:hypothetical protein